MRKMIIGIIILAIVMTGALGFSMFFERKIESLSEQIESAAQYAAAEDYKKAENTINFALNEWLKMHSYAQLLLDGSRVENVTAAFFSYKSALEDAEPSSNAAKESLLYLLYATAQQEKISFGSIM